MKKIILILVLALGSLAANAQIRSFGVTVGPSETVSLQHYVYGTNDFFQLDLGYHTGVPQFGSLRLTASFNRIFLSPQWTEGTWNIYAGPGVQIGSGCNVYKAFNFSIVAQAGIEYIFDGIPLILSADMRPSFGVMLSNDRFRYDIDGLLGFVPAISARYMF